MEKPEVLEDFHKLVKKINVLESIGALLSWDANIEGALPEKALESRANQEATLEEIIHGAKTSPELGKALEILKNTYNLDRIDKALVRDYSKSYNETLKIPVEFAKKRAELLSKAQNIWANAKRSNNFDNFAPTLEEIILMKKQETEFLGYKDSPYDKLLDDHMPEQNIQKLDGMFEKLRGEIVPLVKKIQDRTSQNPDLYKFVKRELDPEKMEEFSNQIVKDMGFDLERGRMAKSPHPFTSGLCSPYDVGITTNIIKKNPDFSDFFELLFAKIHEAGHALFEQGADKSLINTGLTGSSLDIHESQSRLWENIVGRSRHFWNYYFPKLKETFPQQLEDVSLNEFYKAINQVKPSFIRIQADEVTYNLHIMLRYEIEKVLITENSNELKETIKNLPRIWNDKMQEYLGIVPTNNTKGVLQDVHWSLGALGYFPAYTLGNLASAQLYNQAKKEIPDLESKIEKGDLKTLRNWLEEKIHKDGSIDWPDEIMNRITGESLKADYFVDYLKEKYSDIYNL